MAEQAWRLIFDYEGDEFSFRSAQRLAKRVPRGQHPDPQRNGRFVELRGPDREVLYRRAVDQLIPDTVEYPTGDPAQPLGRVAGPRHGEVIILVPDEPAARSVAIVAVSPRTTGGKRKTPRTDQAGSPRDLIAVDLPREGQSS
jgi:hypothetical protein